MYISRRTVVLSSLAMMVADRVLALPQGVGQLPAKPMPAGKPVPNTSALLSRIDQGLESAGERPAYQSEWDIVTKIIDKAPKTVNPFKVAQYFEGVGKGLENTPGEDLSPFVREWPVRYNPLILIFFNATNDRKPVGDCTPWCAAFVNWCIRRGREGRPSNQKLTPDTNNPSSQSFKNFGVKTSNPKPGDIVVFEDFDTSGKATGRGHVAFFVSHTSDHITVIGGNQTILNPDPDPKKNASPENTTCSAGLTRSAGGGVTQVTRKKDIQGQRLFSFQTDPSLHDLT